jgi:hypothetical protein
VLTGAAVIAPLALTRLDAANYLRKHLPPDPEERWARVLGQLETGTAGDLAAVTASPLGLWLVRTVYLDAHQDPTPLIEDTHPDRSTHPTLRAHLLDQLIPAVLHTRPPTPRHRNTEPDAPLRPSRRYDPDDMRKWLTTLAEELHTTGTRDWLWWHLARHTFPTTRTALTARLGTCLAVGLVDGLVYGLVYGLIVGLAFGLVGGLGVGLTAVPQHTDLRLRGRIPKLLRSLARGLGVGLAFGLGGGLAYGLVSFGASPSIAQRASSPVGSQRDDKRLTILVTSTVVLAVGLLFG